MTTKERIQYQILQGNLQMPTIKGLKEKFGSDTYREIELMFEAMWHTYLRKGQHLTPKGEWSNTISTIHWAKRIVDPKAHNIALKMLSKAGWIKSDTRPNNNWSDVRLNEDKLLEYVDETTLGRVRLHNKFVGYVLTNNKHKDLGATKTSVRGKVQNTGLIREGFAKAAALEFQFDTTAMEQYKTVVTEAINKGIEKTIKKYPHIKQDHANYKELGTEIVQYYINAKDARYCAGNRTSDPRGRNNAGYL